MSILNRGAVESIWVIGWLINTLLSSGQTQLTRLFPSSYLPLGVAKWYTRCLMHVDYPRVLADLSANARGSHTITNLDISSLATNIWTISTVFSFSSSIFSTLRLWWFCRPQKSRWCYETVGTSEWLTVKFL